MPGRPERLQDYRPAVTVPVTPAFHELMMRVAGKMESERTWCGQGFPFMADLPIKKTGPLDPSPPG